MFCPADAMSAGAADRDSLLVLNANLGERSRKTKLSGKRQPKTARGAETPRRTRTEGSERPPWRLGGNDNSGSGSKAESRALHHQLRSSDPSRHR